MFFSLFCVLTPLLALIGVRKRILTMYAAKSMNFILLGKFFGMTLGIPTFFASWCWELDINEEQSSTHFMRRLFVNVCVPLACFVSFILHPTVGQGWVYALFWIIPMALFFLQQANLVRKNAFVTALRSTFIAHAIGSVIWCYMVPMGAQRWLALIPVVAVERLFFASAMTSVYRIWNWLMEKDIIPLKKAIKFKSSI